MEEALTNENNSQDLATLDQNTNDVYDGKTEVKQFFDIGLTGKVNSPMNVKNVLTGDYPKAPPNVLPKGQKFDFENYVNAQRNESDIRNLANEDENAWSTVYSYNPSATGNNFYEKYKDMNNWGGPEFHPLHNNAENFNTQTNFLGDLKRSMLNTWGPQFIQGAYDNYMSLNRMFQLEDPFTPGVDQARNYSYNTALSYSTKNNLGSFVNNLTSNFAYTAGLLGTAIAENYIGSAVSGLRNLAGAGSFGYGASKLALQNLEVGKTAIDGIHTYSQLLSEFGGDINKMREFYNQANNVGKFQKAITSPLGKAINPFSNLTDNYYSIINSANDFSGYAQTLRNFTNTAGAAWRDIRNINLALSESSLEAGMVQNNMVDGLYREFYAKNNRAPDRDEMQNIVKHAKDAAFETSVMNVGLIYLTNKVSFDNILNPSVGARGVLRQKVANWRAIGGGKGGTRFGDIGNVGLETASGTWKFYEKGFKTWWNGWKTDPLSKSIWNTVGYFKRNFMEGTQETLQETISGANEKYFTEVYHSGTVRKNFINRAVFGKGTTPLGYYGESFGNQLSAEGFSTFASGFAMGSMAGGLNSTMDFLYTRGNQIFDPKGYEEYKVEKTKIKDELVDRMNAVTVDDFLSSKLFNAGTQDVISGVQAGVDKKELLDTKDEAMIEHINMLMDYGVYDMYIDNFKSYKQMTDAEFEEAFPKIPKGEAGKYKAKIDTVIEEAGKIKDLRNFYNAKYPNPVDLTKYDKSDYDYDDAYIMHHMWNHAIKTAVFYNKSWEDVKGRMVSILDSHYSQRPLDSMTKRDSDIILRVNEMKNEIGLLKNEVDTLTNLSDPDSKKLAKIKAKKVRDLEQYIEVYNVFDNYYHRDTYKAEIKKELQDEKGEDVEVTEEEIEERLNDYYGPKSEEAEKDILLNLKKSYNKLLKTIAVENDDSFFDSKNDESFNLVLDYYKLKDESRTLVDYINLINDPNGFIDTYKRNLKWMEKLWERRGEYYNDIVKTELSNIEDNGLLNNLANLGIYMESSDFIRWRDEGIPPKEFYDEKKSLVIPEGSLAYDRYMYKLQMAKALKEMQDVVQETVSEGEKESRIAQLSARKQSQLDKAQTAFEENILDETGKTEQELREIEKTETTGETAQQINEQIADLNSQIKLIEETNSVEELLGLFDAFNQQGFIPENYNDIIDQELPANKKKIQDFIKLAKKTGAPVEAIQQAAGVKLALPKILNTKIDELKVKETIEPSLTVETTKSWNEYQLDIAKIEERYNKYLQKLTGTFTSETIEAEETTIRKEEIEVTSDMLWDTLPSDFKAQLEPLFKKYVSETLKKPSDFETLDPRKYEIVRQNWFEQQKTLIEQYNKTPVEKKSFIPELKFAALERPITTYGATQLRSIKDNIQRALDRGYRIDPVTQEQIQLTALDKTAARADVKALEEYLNYIRVTYVPKNNADRVFRIFEEMVINKQNNVQRELDADGYVIGYVFPGKEGKPMRVTKYTEQIELDMLGKKDPFMYDAIKEQYEEDGKMKGGQLLNLFRSVVSDTDIKVEERALEFMRRLEADVRSGSLKQLNSVRKLERIKTALTNNFTEEALIAVVDSVAFDESTTAGKTIDEMARIALKRNPNGKGFMIPEKPAKMAQKAYDALFGNNGVITKLQEQVIDGKYEILTDDVLIFDESLLENGIVGAMDIVAFDKTTGKFSIIDIKTSTETGWTDFYKKDKLLNYRIQQTIYRNITFNQTGELAEKLALLPIAIIVDMDGNILSAESAAKIINKDIIRDLKNQLLTLEETLSPNDNKIIALKKSILDIETSDTVILNPVEEVATKYGIKMTKPTLPANLQDNAIKGEKEVMDQVEVKKNIRTTKTQITATQKKLDGLKDGGVIYLGDAVVMSPEYDKLTAKIKALKESLTKLEEMIVTPVPKKAGSTDTNVKVESDLDAEIEALKLIKEGIEGSVTGAPTLVSVEDFNNYISSIIKAKTLDQLELAYADAVIMIIAEPELSFGEILKNAYEIKKRGLAVDVSEQNLEIGEYLISKIPIFTENAGEKVVVAKAENGKVTVKQIGVKKAKQRTFSEKELNSKFSKITDEALNQIPETKVMDEEQKINSEISKTSTKDFAGNKDLIAIAKTNSKQTRKERLAALKEINSQDNINNCNE